MQFSYCLSSNSLSQICSSIKNQVIQGENFYQINDIFFITSSNIDRGLFLSRLTAL